MSRAACLAFALLALTSNALVATEPPAASELVVGERYEIRIGDAALKQQFSGALLMRDKEWAVFEELPPANAAPDQQRPTQQRWIPVNKVHVLRRRDTARNAPPSPAQAFETGEIVSVTWKTAAGPRGTRAKLQAIDAKHLMVEVEGHWESHHGVPFFSGLPIVGRWFSWTKTGGIHEKHDIPRADLLSVTVFVRPEGRR